jgi:hypothetical protein
MPTIDITAAQLPEIRRRAVALSVTRWMRDRGIEPSHVTVRFTPWPTGTVYSGGMPVDALIARHDPMDGPAAVSISCALDPARDETFRQELAEHLVSALGLGPSTPFFYLELRGVSPRDAYLLHDGLPRPVTQPSTRPEPEAS